MFIQRSKRNITADTDIDPEVMGLVLEPEDVADLLAEVTGEDVAATVDEDSIVFTIGEEDFTVSAEGDEEVLELSDGGDGGGDDDFAMSTKSKGKPVKAATGRRIVRKAGK